MLLAGTSWDHEVSTEAQHALQLRYGFNTAVQAQKALQLALQKIKSMYGRTPVSAG